MRSWVVDTLAADGGQLSFNVGSTETHIFSTT
jgi:hypothetical protein